MTLLDSQRNSGRNDALFEFTQGISVDKRLGSQEIRVQIAWAQALVGAKVLSESEAGEIQKALEGAERLIAEGKFDWRIQDEDIHMNLERFVTEKCGELGKRMHLGRSRNDLIASTLRLFVFDSIGEVSKGVRDIITALCLVAEKEIDILVPGTTHLQHGQPIRFSHALVAHGWGFQRDLERLEFSSRRAMATLPLGSAALAGTTLDLDLAALARALGFQGPTLNSYDSVGDRDFLVETLDAYASVALHLSRLSEDFVIWSSSAVGLLRLPKDWSTGSSIMPNKRNPDVPELIRGKSAHVLAASSNAHFLMKAVPTSYGSDLHELKSVYLRAYDELISCFSVLPGFIAGLSCDPKRAQGLLRQGHILATEMADKLAAGGMPFRDAYAKVAVWVEQAEAQGIQVHELETGWTFEAAVERRKNSGGTARASILEGLACLREKAKGPQLK